ncbi:unnamed protein product [Angiostrongylus costaricensis]|uniref:ShKT domain-containing protein n=1 Tax=Angiostrongylus costaricensis TaxID=334426 RepID=A0A0R3PD97_ANGCS|nr:unnamed protein product [Angiostrongylus costaricensis]
MGAMDRDAKCSRVNFTIQDEVGANQELKQLAISTCPKHCGYCCETPEYKCDNKLFPRVKCETVTQNQCSDPLWRAILAEDCPKVCGLCLAGGCVDKVVECANDPAICRQIDMQVFVKVRTYYFFQILFCCTFFSCNSWALNGFCTNTFFNETLRRQHCAKTCNLC